MARIVSIGAGLEDIYLIDRDDLMAMEMGGQDFFGKMVVGSKIDIDRMAFEVGGGGVNSAVSFARHGHEVALMSNVARDPAGAAVVKTLDREGIDSSYVHFLKHETTGTSVILLDSRSGERTILTCRGASEKFDDLSEEDLPIIQPDWLYVTTLRGDFESLKRFFKKAQEIGAKVMFNPGVRELAQKTDLTKLLEYVDILILNKAEAASLVPGVLLTELLAGLKNYVRTVIITDGSMGGIATDGVETYRFGLYENCKIKDATGAGDAFGSGFLAHLASGNNFCESLIFAAANSTSVVTRIGANRGILTGREKLHPMPIQKI